MKRLITAVLAACALSACATQTPYEPATRHNWGQGYSDTRIETDRYRVTFSGNWVTSRQIVENYMLYRAAELTIQNGFDWFETVDRSTEIQTGYDGYGYGYGYGADIAGPGYGGWAPFWNGYGDVGSWDEGNAYQVQANIIMHHGPKPRGEAHAFDAREVMSNLSHHIIWPKNSHSDEARGPAPALSATAQK